MLVSPLLFSSLLLLSSELLSVLISGSLLCDDESEGSETEVVSPMLPPSDDTAEEADDELQAVSAAVQESIRDTAMSFIYNFFIFIRSFQG